MGFYQFFIIFICNTYLILFNGFTAKAADTPPSLTLKHSGVPCPTPSRSSNASASSSLSSSSASIFQCVVGNPFEKFSLECIPSSLPSDFTVAWYQGSKIKSDYGKLIEGNERIQLEDDNNVLTFKSLDVTDNGVYHCRVVKKDEQKTSQQYSAQQSIEILVLPRVANVRKDVTAIEENPFSLNCSVISSIPVKVIWLVDTPSGGNKTYEASEGRIELKGNETLTNNQLVIKSANMSLDRGTYVCYARSDYGYSSANMTFLLRVKSKYAALWPFLGICTEVIILCVIILIYEKKRDKTELEESDTDQGPETKSSPDHGQDNVRYRK